MNPATHPGRSPRRTTGLLAAVLAAAVVLTACSTQGDRTTESADTPATSSASSVSSAASAASASDTGSASPTGTDQPASDTSTDSSYRPTEPGATTPESGAAPATDTPVPSSDTPAPAPAATTAVAQPTPGDVNQTVPDQDITTLPAVPVGRPADFGTGVTATVDSLGRIDAVGRGPGEISGPALSYRLTLTNTTGQDLDLSTVGVNVQDAAGTPFSPVDNDPAVPFTGTLAPGQSASATYVFTLPSDYTAPATLSLAYSASAPIVLFAGDAQ